MKTTQVEIPLGVQSWGQRPGCEASRASHCPSGQERGCKKIFSAQLSVCCFNISTCWLINIIRQVCSILKLMEPVESRCRRRRAAWTWWRSWTLARSSGKPRRWEGGVLSCSPPCFDIIMDMMYTLIIDGGHFWHDVGKPVREWEDFLWTDWIVSIGYEGNVPSCLHCDLKYFFSCLHKKVDVYEEDTCFRIQSTKIWRWGTFCSHRPLSGSQPPWVELKLFSSGLLLVYSS